MPMKISFSHFITPDKVLLPTPCHPYTDRYSLSRVEPAITSFRLYGPHILIARVDQLGIRRRRIYCRPRRRMANPCRASARWRDPSSTGEQNFAQKPTPFSHPHQPSHGTISLPTLRGKRVSSHADYRTEREGKLHLSPPVLQLAQRLSRTRRCSRRAPSAPAIRSSRSRSSCCTRCWR